MPSAYAIAHLRTPQLNDDVLDYLERIQATLDPFGGRFLVHGAEVEVIEGTWPGTIVIIEFPGVDEAHRWYESRAYQEILPLRTDHIDGEAIIVERCRAWLRPSAPRRRGARQSADQRLRPLIPYVSTINARLGSMDTNDHSGELSGPPGAKSPRL